MPRFKHEFGAFDYQLIRTARRTISIQIDPAKGVIVRAPKKAKTSEISNLLEKKIRWVNKHLAEARNKASEVLRHSYQAGDVFLQVGIPRHSVLGGLAT